MLNALALSTMDRVVALSALLTFVGIALFAWSMWHLRVYVRETRKETSRFKMFAARDKLVELVATGEMKEVNPAWSMCYASVNALLSLHERLNAHDVLKQYGAFLIESVADPRKMQRDRDVRRMMDAAARAHPSFREALAQVSEAFDVMVSMRSGRLDRVKCWLYLQWFRMTLQHRVLAALHARQARAHGKRSSLDVRKAAFERIRGNIGHPAPSSVVQFGESSAAA